ncbi:MAG TPA: TrkH family potassium uptake protein [Clostridiales bacterium]|nr:TrkH family potassium uptake protein [Clostridiales bacterium]
MDFGIILKALGLLLLVESASMLPSLGVAMYYRQGDAKAFMLSIIITLTAGLIMTFASRSKKGMVRYKEGFMIVGFGWVLASAFGALPFYLSGSIDRFVDAFFESVSGFTTTGASILNDVEAMPEGLLFWRSFTHWLGGMGILVFTMALLPAIGAGSLQIFKAETTGPTTDKLTPKIGQTAKMLYFVYLIITVAQVIILRISGMPLFDSLIHTFGTVGTGGFSNYSASIGHYRNPVFEWVITIFMFICGVNFSLYYDALHGNFRTLLKDKEFQLYAIIVLSSILLVAVNINSAIYHNAGESVRYASFQVLSIISTSGFASTDFDLWPDFSRMILLLLMFFGSCAGSTAGGMKIIRLLLVFKVIRRQLYRSIHPRAVIAIRVGSKTISDETLHNVFGFIMLHLLIFIVSTLVLLAQGWDILSSVSAIAATLNNVGPGLNLFGPSRNFSILSDFSKILLSALMLLGRLEINTLFILLSPNFWKR